MDPSAAAGICFLDVEADRGGHLLVVAAIRGDETLRLDARAATTRAELQRFLGEHPVGGHNLLRFDLPLLRDQLGIDLGGRPLVDSLLLSMMAWPDRPTHALDKADGDAAHAARVPDPLEDARRARRVTELAMGALAGLDPTVASFYATLLARNDHGGSALVLPGAPVTELHDAVQALPEDFLERACRVHLGHLLGELAPDDASTALGLALALRFIEARSYTRRDADHVVGGVHGPPSAALMAVPRFSELLTRLMGPLCPDPSCVHRARCHVHRPFAEEILRRNFDLPGFRPGQAEIVAAVLGDRAPLVILPTGGGKSLCYQLPAVHGGDRLHGLTVVISPLQALMADQVSALSARYPPSCFINASLLMEERSEHLQGLRSGKYNVLYIGPEQLRNPSMVRLLRGRPPLLWVVDEAHCISQWGHSFRTDYTYLPRAIAAIHPHGRRPLLALFTATATADVRVDIAAQMRAALGVELTEMDFGARRDNLRYEVVPCRDAQHKQNELKSQLAATTDGARLVYCATTRQAAETAEMLRVRGVPCAMYHGQLTPPEKKDQLEQFLSGRASTVVATSAFGMGIDKADIRLVVHYDIPGSIEDYVQETGRAGRDGAPARCVLLFQEEDLDTQFFLKTATRITERDVRFVFRVLRRRASKLKRLAGDDGWVDLWVSAEDLFVEESLEERLDWSPDTLHHKLKLVLYHLEADGVVRRLENRTRTFGIYPRLDHLAEAEHVLRAELGERASPATVRVLHYLYDPERPRRISVLDIADACGLTPRRAFEQVQALTTLGLVGQDLAFEVTLAHGVARPSHLLAHDSLTIADTLFAIGDDLDDGPVLRLRGAAAEIGRVLGRRLAPHLLPSLLRALRRHGLVQLDKLGPDLYRVRFEPGAVAARDRLRRAQRVAGALFEYLHEKLGSARGRDVAVSLDVDAFLERPSLTERFTHEEVVATCLLLHHLQAWHLADPPVLFDLAMRVRVDPTANLGDVDTDRPDRHHRHQIQLVHMMREYAVLEPSRRQRYVDDYFRLPAEVLADKYFHRRKKAIQRSVSAAAEERILEGLTSAQRDAVTAEDRAVLVVAGPGSGKTHTVVRRITHMVRARQIRADHILVLAFNRSAAAELRARLGTALGPRASWVDVRTFHSLAIKLTGAELFDGKTAEADPETRLDEAMVEAAALLSAGDEDDRERATYLRDQVLGGVRHVLVDEYQDLDAAQYALLTALVGLDRKRRGLDRTERSVYVVGDDDQAIYGFRNASVEFLHRYEAEFGARRICLRDNFRSNRRIVAAAQRFIEGVPGRLKSSPDEQMVPAATAAPGHTRAVRRLVFATPGQMAAHAAYGVERMLEGGSGTIAVLARHWSSLDPVRFLLEQKQIEVAIHHRDFRRPVHRRHPVAFLLDKLWRKREPLHTSAREHLIALLAGVKRGLDEPVARELLALADDIDRERQSAGRLPYFGARRGRDVGAHTVEGGQLMLMAAEPVTLAKPGSPLLAPMTTAQLADALVMGSRDAASRDLTSKSDETRVHLSTYHGAKGLEFDHVILLPGPSSPTDDAEERRAFYVAMTRARHELSLASVGAVRGYAATVEAPVMELGGVARKLGTVRAAYLDCDPSQVWLLNRALAYAQRVIARLREGEALRVEEAEDGKVHLHAEGGLVATLSRSGVERYRAMRRHAPGPVAARVRELLQQHERAEDGTIVKRWLVVLPTLHVGSWAPA